MPELVYLNGRIGSFIDTFISINDRGYNFGDGIYEVIRVYDGTMFALEDHLDRLKLSAQAIEMSLPWSRAQIQKITEDVLAQSKIKEAMIYIQLSRGIAPRNHLYVQDLKPNLLITVRHVPGQNPSHYSEGVKIITMPEFRWQMCNVKSISLLGNVLAKNRAHRAGAEEAAFVLPDGTVTECSSSNIFIYKDGALITHPADNKILDGITRKAVLQIAQTLGLPVEVRPFKINELLTADESFFTGTVVEIMPVVEVDGQIIGNGKPGKITDQLHRGYRSLQM